jgi:integrase
VQGTKNDSRRNRTVFVDRWAWPVVQSYAKRFMPRAKLFPSIGDGKRLREAFYEAQVTAGLIDDAALSKSGKKLWKAVSPHTLHDARHTYCYCRMLGLDGEARESTKFCSHQLGHGSEQMVNQIYAKANLEARIRQLAAEEAAA